VITALEEAAPIVQMQTVTTLQAIYVYGSVLSSNGSMEPVVKHVQHAQAQSMRTPGMDVEKLITVVYAQIRNVADVMTLTRQVVTRV